RPPCPHAGQPRAPRDRGTRYGGDSGPRPRRSRPSPAAGSCRFLPAGEELRPVRSLERPEVLPERRKLGLVLVGRPEPAKELEATIDQIRVRDVGLAVVADLGQAAGLVGIPDLGAIHAELARKTAKPREII